MIILITWFYWYGLNLLLLDNVKIYIFLFYLASNALFNGKKKNAVIILSNNNAAIITIKEAGD